MKIEFYDKVTGDVYDDPKKFIIDHEGNVYHEYGDCYAPHIAWRIIDQWQPIETAPKDGTDIIVGPIFASWRPNMGWVLDDYAHIFPRHWMPLPPNPKDKE